MFGLCVRRPDRRAWGLVLAAMVAVVLFGAAPAHAAWTKLMPVGDGSALLACKTPESGGYGPVWKISLVLASSRNYAVGSATVDVRRNGALVSRTRLNTWAPGQWDVDTTYASRLFPDRLRGVAGFGDGQGHGLGDNFNVSMSQVGWC